jgi:hypothetical protein
MVRGWEVLKREPRKGMGIDERRSVGLKVLCSVRCGRVRYMVALLRV